MAANNEPQPLPGITAPDSLSTSTINIDEVAKLYYQGKISSEDMRNYLNSNSSISTTRAVLRAGVDNLLGNTDDRNILSLSPIRSDVPFRFSFSNYGGIKSPSTFSVTTNVIVNGSNIRNDLVVLPVPPANIKVVDENSIEEIGTVSGNNFIHGGSRPLEEITLEGFFPKIEGSRSIPSYIPSDTLRLGLVDAPLLKDLFWRAMKAAQPLYFKVSKPGTLDINGAVLYSGNVIVKSFEFEYRAGSGLDIYYTMTLKRWYRQSFRAPLPPREVKYTIKRGDTLWKIADKFLGDGRKWREIFRYNRAVLDKALRDRGQKAPNPNKLYAGTIIKIRIPRSGT